MFYNLDALKDKHLLHTETKYYKQFSCQDRAVLPPAQK